MTAKAPAPSKIDLAFSYVRFSSRKQSKGDSYRRQTELAAAYCRRREWTLSEKTYEDLGVSAFKGKNALVGRLGEFLKAVKSGAVPEGSALIVESIDRISRQGIDEGYDVIKRLLKSGIILVTLTPEREFDVSATKSLSKGALEIQFILERAAEESERRSERVAAAWVGKRICAREKKVMPPRKDTGRLTESITNQLPAWVRDNGGKLELIPEKADVVRLIFRLAADGYGRSLIVQALKAKGIPSFSGKAEWPSCTVGFILTDRRALGEYQPCSKPRTKDGEVIPNYYPAAVEEQDWLAARAGMVRRRRTLRVEERPWTAEEDLLVRQESVGVVAQRTGRSRAAVYQRRHAMGLTVKPVKHTRGSTSNFVNVFSGLIRNARPPHDNYRVMNRMDGSGPSRALVNAAHLEGGKARAKCYLFQLAPFEKALLSMLKEVDPREVLPPAADAKPDEEAQLQGQVDAVGAELTEAAAWMEQHGFSPTVGKRIATLEAKKGEMETSLLDVRAKAATPPAEAWKEYGSLVDALDNAPDPRDARVRLHGALKRMVDEVRLLVVPRGRDRLAAAQVNFRGGGRRDYLIWYQPASNNGRGPKGKKAGCWQVRSWRAEDLAGILPQPDLRDDTEPEGMEAYFKALSREQLERFVFGGCPVNPLP